MTKRVANARVANARAASPGRGREGWPRIWVSLPPALYDRIDASAARNFRSLSSEVAFALTAIYVAPGAESPPPVP